MGDKKIRKIQEPIEPCSIWGWADQAEVALDVYSSMHDSLLSGNLLFAWQGESKGLKQLIIVRNIEEQLYSIGIITSGHTALIPAMPLEYLQTVLLEDLVDKYKLRTDIIESYKQILKNEITSD